MSKHCRPRVYGTGLIVLDLVESEVHPSTRLWAGGTCGNVLSILAFLGWDALPVSRLRRDPAAEYVRSDLSRSGVRLDFLHLEPASDTPVIYQRIRKDSAGIPFHTFSWVCPGCGGRFPRYSPVTQATAQRIAGELLEPTVFFFDRVSRGSLTLAQTCAERGAVVVFEPSGIGDPALFAEALKTTHILKYSHERMRSSMDLVLPELWRGAPVLEIETLGRGGLRYRCHTNDYSAPTWELVRSYNVPGLRDTSGAGDWSTAGVVSQLSRGGVAGLLRADRSQVLEALAFGQALGAWNCGFEGARGGMETVDREELLSIIAQVIEANGVSSPVRETAPASTLQVLHGICSNCAGRTDETG